MADSQVYDCSWVPSHDPHHPPQIVTAPMTPDEQTRQQAIVDAYAPLKLNLEQRLAKNVTAIATLRTLALTNPVAAAVIDALGLGS